MTITPFFSIVIPTRNRPELFKLALDSVLAQNFESFEVVVVNDGSTAEYLQRYRDVQDASPSNVTWHYLVHRPNGHGQSYSMNYGTSHAQGAYVCFLDDDDCWTDSDHLQRAFNSIRQAAQPVDLYLTNQKAYFPDGSPQTAPLWIDSIRDSAELPAPDPFGSHVVTTTALLKCKGFAHLNCSIYRKGFYADIGGMDENIRYECDRDIYIRAIDRAAHILYNYACISLHRIPDKTNKSNMSTLVSVFEKKLYQLRVFDKGMLFSERRSVRQFCKRAKAYELKSISEHLAGKKDYDLAFYYARESLLLAPGIKWLGLTLYYLGRKIASS